MKLKELLKLVQTDPTEALKVAFEMGSYMGTADQEYTEDQFMAYMDGAKDSIEIESDKIAKLNERISILEKEKTVLPSYPTYPTQPTTAPTTAPTVSPFWYMDGPTCQAKSTDSVGILDSLKPRDCNNV